MMPRFCRPQAAAFALCLAGGLTPSHATGLDDLEVKPTFARTCFARDEAKADLSWQLTNRGATALQAKVAISADDEFLMKEREIALDPGASLTLATEFSPARFPVGTVDFVLHGSFPSGKARKAISEMRIAPWRDPARFEVAAWPRLKETSCIKEMLDAGLTVVPFGTMDDLDRLTLLGGRGGIQLVTYRDGICPLSAEYHETCSRAVDDLLAKLESHPSLHTVVLNTERWGSICFCAACKSLYKQKTGVDPDLLETWVKKQTREWKSKVLIPPIPEYLPKGGVVEEDNPLWRFARWWWEQGGINVTNQRMAERISSRQPSVLALTEPVMRFGCAQRYRPPIVMSDWHYPGNPNTWLPILAYLKGVQRFWGVRFIPTIGLVKLAGTFAPYDVTSPPDLLKIESWLCFARIPEGMDYFLWQAVQDPEHPIWNTATVAECEQAVKGLPWAEACKAVQAKRVKQAWVPGAPEAVKELAHGLFRPYGPLVRKLSPAPARVAVLYPFAAAVLGPRPWYLSQDWLPALAPILAGPCAVDVLFDADARDSATLARYAVIVLPSAYVFERKAVENLSQYVRAGGTVLAGEACRGKIPGAVILPALDADSKAGKLEAEAIAQELSRKLPPERVSENKDIILREAHAPGVTVLFAVNASRVAGPLFGHYPGALEKGAPAEAEIRVRKQAGQCAYDLTSSREVPLTSRGEYWAFRDTFPAAWGRIYGFYPERIKEVRLAAPPSAEPGGLINVEVNVLNEQGQPFRGALPLSVQMTAPNGSKFDRSHAACADGGSYQFSWHVPVATRRSPSQTGAWTIVVTERASGSRAEAHVKVAAKKPDPSGQEKAEPAGAYMPQ